jgi:tetratricopeptide (TPR) repeat protein
MNVLPQLVFGIAAGGLAGYFAGSFAQSESDAVEAAAPGESARISELEAEIRALRQDLEAPRPIGLAESGGRVAADTEAQLQAAIDAWMAENLEARLQQAAGAASAGSAGDAEPGQAKFTNAEEAILAMQAADGWDAQMEAMQAAADAGLLDAVIEELEKRAELQPDSENAQLELAAGYLQKVFSTTNPIETGTWAVKLDGTYDEALAINDQSWDARFGKAMSLSNWPAFTGKQGEAIRQFEILRGQQANAASRPEFAQTYLILGNMYQQSGRMDEARAAWQDGANRFPNNAELLGQLDQR